MRPNLLHKLPFLLTFPLLALCFSVSAQNVGVGTATPIMKLHVRANAATDGIIVDNVAGNGDPVLQFRTNGTRRITMGIDDSDSDKFKIGTTATSTNTRITIETGGDIGIRTTTPAHLLHMTNGGVTVGGTAMAMFENLGISGVSITGRNNNTTSGYNAVEGITDYNGTGFIPAGVFGLALYNGPNLSPTIGVRGHSNEWQGTGVRGTRFNGGGGNTGWGGQIYDDLGYTGFFGLISDARTKKDVRPIMDAVAIVDQLNPVQYHYDLDKYPNMGLNREEEFGFIAQEVQQVLPNITRTKNFSTNACLEITPGMAVENDNEQFLTMDYTRIIPILTQAIKEQQAEIEDLEQKAAKVDVLENEVDALRQQLQDLTQRLNRLDGGN